MATDNNNKVLNVPNLRFPEFTEEWKETKIGDITSKVGSGVTPKGGSAVYKTSGHLFIRSQNVGNGRFLLDDVAYIDEATHKKQINTELKDGDVLLNITGASIGRTTVVNKNVEGGNVNQHVCIIRLLEDYSPNYICNYLLSYGGQKQIDSFQAGGNREGLNFEQIRSIKFFIPSFREQSKIALLLSLLEERIATQNKIIEDLKKLKVAISNRLLNNKTLLNKTAPLSKFGDLKNGYAFKSSAYVPNGNYNIVTIANVNGDREIVTDNCNTISSVPTDIQSHQILKSGDILISLTGNVGRVSLNKGNNNLLNQRVGLFVPNNSISSEFLYQTLSFVQFENSMINLAQGAAQLNIGKGDVESYQVRYSENEHLISQITQILLGYDKKIEIENKYLQSLLAQKSYLLSNMFI